MKIIALTVAFTLMATLVASETMCPSRRRRFRGPANPTLQTWNLRATAMKACAAGSIQTRWSCTLSETFLSSSGPKG